MIKRRSLEKLSKTFACCSLTWDGIWGVSQTAVHKWLDKKMVSIFGGPQYPPFWCNGGFPCYIFQKIMHKK